MGVEVPEATSGVQARTSIGTYWDQSERGERLWDDLEMRLRRLRYTAFHVRMISTKPRTEVSQEGKTENGPGTVGRYQASHGL